MKKITLFLSLFLFAFAAMAANVEETFADFADFGTDQTPFAGKETVNVKFTPNGDVKIWSKQIRVYAGAKLTITPVKGTIISATIGSQSGDRSLLAKDITGNLAADGSSWTAKSATGDASIVITASRQVRLTSLTLVINPDGVPEAGGGTEGGGTVDPQPGTITEVADLAAFNAVTGKNINKEYKITGEIQVSFKNEYDGHITVYAQDAKGAIEFKDDTFGAKVNAGDKLTGLVAKTVEYKSGKKTKTKIQVVTTPTPVAGTFTPEVLTLDKVTKEKINRFVEVKDVQLSEIFDRNNAKVTDGVTTITIRNHYQIVKEDAAVVGDKVSFTGVVSEYNGMQVKLVTYEKAVVPEGAVATPVFSETNQYVVDSLKLTITCATEGAEIHYTLNGGADQVYAEPIVIKEETVVKAWAVKGADKSNEAAIKYMFPKAVANLVEFFKEGEFSETLPMLIQSELLVTYVGPEDVYLKDDSAAVTIHGKSSVTKFKQGDKLTGLVATYTTYNKVKQMNPVFIPVAKKGVAEPVVVTMADALDWEANCSQYVLLKNVTILDSVTFKLDSKINAKVVAGNDTLTIRSQFVNLEGTFNKGDKVDVTGIVSVYDSKAQLLAAEIVPAVVSFATVKEMVDFVTRPDATEDEMYGIYDVKEPVYVTYIMDPADPMSPMTVQTVGENPLYFTVYVSESGLGQNIEGRPDSLAVGDKLEGLQIGYLPVEEDAGEILSSAALYLEAAKYANDPIKIEYKPVTVDEMNADMVKLVAQPIKLKEAVLTYDPDMGASIGDIMLLVFDDLTELNGKKCNFEGVMLLEGGVYMFGVNSIEEVPSTAVENIELTSSVYVNNGTLFVEAEAGDEINVYTVDGRNIYSAVAASSLNEINVNANMVIVRVNSEVHKVVLK